MRGAVYHKGLFEAADADCIIPNIAIPTEGHRYHSFRQTKSNCTLKTKPNL